MFPWARNTVVLRSGAECHFVYSGRNVAPRARISHVHVLYSLSWQEPHNGQGENLCTESIRAPCIDMTAVDSSPQILLAKILQLGLLNQGRGDVWIGPTVHAETVEASRAIQAPDVQSLEAAINSGWLMVASLTSTEHTLLRTFLEHFRFGPGEAEALAIAQTRNICLVIDDKAARNAAKTIGIEHFGTAGELLEAHVKQVLSASDLEGAVRELARRSRISDAVVTTILSQAKGA